MEMEENIRRREEKERSGDERVVKQSGLWQGHLGRQ